MPSLYTRVAIAALAVAAKASAFSTPWPLPLNVTSSGGPSSTASISATFSFTCDPSPGCSSVCATHPIVQAAFARYEARMRPASSASSESSANSAFRRAASSRAASSARYWWRFPGADCDGTQYDDGGCDGSNITACEEACEAKAGCGGFNTHGVLKNTLCGSAPGSILPGAGCNGCVDLYLLRDTPEPPPGVLTSVAVCLLSGDDTLGSATDESYELVAPNEGAGSLTARTMFGALHGLETLAQLLDIYGVSPGTRQISMAPVTVVDAPRFTYRGLLVDSSRHFLPVATILSVIDALAYSKMNLLHWHIVDSCSFPCGSAFYPELAEKGAWDPSAIYSVTDLKTVVAYGKARGVRILPEWDVPGHGAWGRGHPEIMGCSDVLDPTSNATYNLLKGFFSEMATIFEDDWMFLGGDEVEFTCWDSNPAIEAWLKAHNMTSADLQQYFWQEMQVRVLPFLNKTIGVWEADNLQIDLSSLPGGAFVNVYQSLDTANRTVLGNKTTVQVQTTIPSPARPPARRPLLTHSLPSSAESRLRATTGTWISEDAGTTTKRTGSAPTTSSRRCRRGPSSS